MSTNIVTQDINQGTLATLPENLQAKIREASEKLRESASVSVTKIRNDAKNYIFPDGTEVDSFHGIIVSAKHANIHYAGEYEEGVSNPPDCIAVLENTDDAKCINLLPHSVVTKPYHNNCNDCAKFQWGSDRGGKGKGKECSEYVLLAVHIPVLGDELFLVEEKKGNAKVADSYLRTVTDKFGHPIAVTTKFTMGAKAKWAQSMEATSVVPQELMTNLAERIDAANNMLAERVLGTYKIAEKPVEVAASDQASNPGRKARSR